jgi:hypothetical protein
MEPRRSERETPAEVLQAWFEASDVLKRDIVAGAADLLRQWLGSRSVPSGSHDREPGAHEDLASVFERALVVEPDLARKAFYNYFTKSLLDTQNTLAAYQGLEQLERGDPAAAADALLRARSAQGTRHPGHESLFEATLAWLAPKYYAGRAFHSREPDRVSEARAGGAKQIVQSKETEPPEGRPKPAPSQRLPDPTPRTSGPQSGTRLCQLSVLREVVASADSIRMAHSHCDFPLHTFLPIDAREVRSAADKINALANALERFSSWLTTVAPCCARPEGEQSGLLGLLARFTDTVLQPGWSVRKIQEASGLAQAVLSETQGQQARLAEMGDSIVALSSDLGLPDLQGSTVPIDCVCALDRALHEAESCLSELSSQRMNRCAELRQNLRTRLLAMQGLQYLLPSDTASLVRLTEAVSSSECLKPLMDLANSVGEIETSFALRRRLGSNDVARRLLSDGLAAPAIFDLAESLLAEGKPALAVTYLTLLQHAVAPEDVGVDDFSGFFSTLMSATTTLANDEALLGPAVACVVDAPWISALNGSDIQQASTRTTLAGTLLRFLLLGGGEDVRLLAERYRAFDTFRSGSVLWSIAGLVRRGAQWRVADSTPEAIAEELLKAANARIEAAFVGLIRKNPIMGNRFAKRFRSVLSDLWAQVSSEARRDPKGARACLDQGLDALGKEADRLAQEAVSATFWRNQVSSEIEDIAQAVGSYIDAQLDLVQGPPAFLRAAIQAEIAALREADASPAGVWKALCDEMLNPRTTRLRKPDPRFHPFSRLLATREVVFVAPQLTARSRHEPSLPVWEGAAANEPLAEILRGISDPPATDEARRVLSASSCWDDLSTYFSAVQNAAEGTANYANRAASEKAALSIRCDACEATLAADLRAHLEAGCFPFVMRALSDDEGKRRDRELRASEELNEILRGHRRTIRDLEDGIDLIAMDEDWKARTRRLLHTLLDRCGTALSTQRTSDEKRPAADEMAVAVRRLEAHIRQRSCRFDLLSEIGDSQAPLVHEEAREKDTDLDLASVRRFLTRRGDGEHGLDLRKEVWDRFIGLAACDVGDQGTLRAADEFLGKFAKLLKMYSSERDPERRFSLVPLRDAALRVADTRFQEPGAPYFDRPLRLYVLPGGKRQAALLEAVREDLTLGLGGLKHGIVIAAGEIDRVKQRLDAALRAGRATILGKSAIRQSLEATRPWAPIRRMLRFAVSLKVASPFKSEGYVTEKDGLFVGRADMRALLTGGECFALWGGRRTGKTSLLHAVEQDFAARATSHFHPLYVSMETLGDDPGSVDLNAARQIAAKLGTPAPSSVEEFATLLGDRCRQGPVALLIDEVDGYIRPLQKAGDLRYRLIRELRRIRDEHREQIVCIFAGFTFLSRACSADRPDDSSYPWQSWINREGPLARLTSDETAGLVEKGFCDVLGLDIELSVPELIYDYTAGHPAFVQNFCECVLRRLAQRSRVEQTRVSEAEVRATFDEVSAGFGDDPFINFFARTLNMNLEPLEKLVVYVLAAALIGRAGDPRRSYSREDIAREVNSWFSLVGRRPRTPDEIAEALRSLEMTGMLGRERRPSSCEACYRMEFPMHVEILRRLEEADTQHMERLVEGVPD